MLNPLSKLSKISLKEIKRKSLPDSSGIYVFWKDNTPIYIGKAVNLKNRVSSYFNLHLGPKTSKMVSEGNNLSYIKVNSELESLLLEAKLIRSYMPHYNVISKDDKHPLYIRITKEEFPRIITGRKIDEKERNIAFFGPFPASTNVKSVLKMIRRIFPFSDHKIGKRPCLYSHIGLCNPCPSVIKTEEEKKKYIKNIKMVNSILSGKFKKVESNLTKEMNNFSKTQRFEEAKEILNRIQRLKYITQPIIPTERFLENPNFTSDLRIKELKEIQILLNPFYPHLKAIKRIECFDIAHLAGTYPTASMISFNMGESDKTLYRHFRIKKAKGGDDYSSMGEVARRRSNHFSDWGVPDLIIIDGGVGQVNSFKKGVSKDLNSPIIGIAKNPDRLIIDEKSKIRLTGPALNLIQRMRDEAHRFARRYHHRLLSINLSK